MFELVGRWFVGNPARLALVSGVFFALYFLVRGSRTTRRPLGVLWVASAWAVWAIWELAVLRVSPDANIRVDLLLLAPIVLVATVAGLAAAFWPARR